MPSLTSHWYTTWQTKLSNASLTSLRNVRPLCAFNAVIDNVIIFDKAVAYNFFKHFENQRRSVKHRANSPILRVDSPTELAAVIIQSFSTGKAMHVPSNPQLLSWVKNNFGLRSTSLGGQAGIIANQLALLGAKPIFYTPQLSTELANLFSPRVRFPVAGKRLSFESVQAAGKRNGDQRVNYIFEYKQGDVFEFGGTVFRAPRSNRIILASPQRSPPIFQPALVHFLPELGGSIDAGIFSGYQAIQPNYEDGTTFEYYLSLEELYLTMLKSHTNIPLHVEYVSTPFKQIDKQIYEHVTKHVDSFGINEIELVELSDKLGFSKQGRDVVKSENVVTLHAAAEKILNALHLKRLHVHNLGYHLVLLKKPIDVVHQKKQVNGVLFGSLAATARALKGREITRGEVQDSLDIGVSEIALNQMARMCAHLSLSRSRAEHALLTGIFDMHDHVLLIVPGQVAPITTRTVGLGDVISSCSFLAGL